MSESNEPVVGGITWVDLTVENASATKDFYREVVGWTVTDVEMGGYNDYCMNEPQTGKTVAGICHARRGKRSVAGGVACLHKRGRPG